jgi:hypothetical protein
MKTKCPKDGKRLGSDQSSKRKAHASTITFDLGAFSITYPLDRPGPYPERDWWRLPLEWIEPWWAPDCPADDPKAEPAPHMNKRWSGLWVDSPIKDDWLQRMNSISGMSVDYTDAGHGPGELLYPAIAFELDPRTPLSMSVPPFEEGPEISLAAYMRARQYLQSRFVEIAEVVPEPSSGPGIVAFRLLSWLPRIWMTECQYDAWWDGILWKLENLAAEDWPAP